MDGWFGGGEGLELEMESWEQQLDAELHSSGIQLDWAVGLAPLQVGPAACISNTSPFILDGGVQAPSPALLWDVGAQVLQQHSSDSSRSGSGSGSGMAVAPAHAATVSGARKGGSAAAPKPAGKGVGKAKSSSSAAATRYSTPAARARKQEQQRQYRQRFKQRQSQQEAEVHTAAWMREQLLAERAELQVQEQALLRLEEHCSAMALTLLPPGAHGAGAADAAPRQVPQHDSTPAQEPAQGSGGATSAFENVGGNLLLRTWYPDVGCDVGTGTVQPRQVAQALDAVLGKQSSPRLQSEPPMQAAKAEPLAEQAVGSLLPQCLQDTWQQQQAQQQQQQEEGQQAPSPKPNAQEAHQEQHAAAACNEPSGGDVHGSGSVASSFTGRVSNLLMCNLPDGIWSSLLLPGDRQLRNLVQGITAAQCIARNRVFRCLLQAAVEEWDVSGPTGKLRVERRLQLLWTIRGKFTAMMAQLRPELLCEVMSLQLLPGPSAFQRQQLEADASACAVHHLLPAVVDQLDITPQQFRSLMAAWRQYESLVIAARQQSREALGQMHCVEGRQAGAQGQASTSAAALMKDYVTSFEAAAALATLPREEAAAFVHLNLAVYEILTAMQRSRMLLGCSPYIPDWTQLCMYLEWQHERKQPQIRSAAADPGHLLLASTAAVL